jgi:TPR repeat protein
MLKDLIMSDVYNFDKLCLDAEQGDVKSQIRLGLKYQKGSFGIEKNYQQAMFWYRKAAEQGDASAEYYLGDIFFMGGYGLERDYQQSLFWFRQAAEHGYVYAKFWLGKVYEKGYLNEGKDFERAFFWYLEAAKQGHDDSQNKVGNMYLYGHGTEQDFEQALIWYRSSAKQGNAEAIKKIAELAIRPISNSQKRIGKFIVQDGIATDTTTNLTWLRFSYGQKWENDTAVGAIKSVSWKTAMDMAEKFNEQGGYLDIFDWRLPDIHELRTLIDTIRCEPDDYYIDADVFPNSYDGYWSSNRLTGLSFELDEVFRISDADFSGAVLAVRLVRGIQNVNS